MRRNLPKINIKSVSATLRCEPPASALEKWHPEICAAVHNADKNTINIYEQIGSSIWDDSGFTLKDLSQRLDQAKGQDVNINLNSPGGDFFEGIAMYNLLRDYPGEVNIRIVGLAASAASVLAMAGNNIEIAEAGFFMIHNAWTLAMGNRNDMQDVVDMLEKFDNSMAQLYVKHTGQSEKAVTQMMDDETWISGKDAVKKGFATALLPADELSLDENTKSSYNTALRKVDVALAKQGLPRSERRTLLKELTSTPCAADDIKPCADALLTEGLTSILQTLKQ